MKIKKRSNQMTNLEARIQQELSMIGYWQNKIKDIEENNKELSILIPCYVTSLKRHENQLKDLSELLNQERHIEKAKEREALIYWMDKGRSYE